MVVLEKVIFANFREISKILKITSFDDIYAVVSKLKPKSKRNLKTASKKKKTSTDRQKEGLSGKDGSLVNEGFAQNEEKIDDLSEDSGFRLSDSYWIRGHEGSMILDFLVAYGTANQIDVFRLIPEMLIDNFQVLDSLLPTEIKKVISINPLKPGIQAEDQSDGIEVIAVDDIPTENPEYEASAKQTGKKKSKASKKTEKEEKVFNIADLIKEDDSETADNQDQTANQPEGGFSIFNSEGSAENSTINQVSSEYKILYFNLDEFLELLSNNDRLQENNVQIVCSMLNMLSSIQYSSNSALFLIDYEGKQYSNILSRLFDYELTVPVPTEADRKLIFNVLKDTSFSYTFESTVLAQATPSWTVWDINKLIQNSMHRFELGLCKYDSINSDFILSLINNEKVLPKKVLKLASGKGLDLVADPVISSSYSSGVSSQGFDNIDPQNIIVDSLSDQLYQEAAFKEFDNLSRIIQDIISQKAPDQEDYKMLSNYAFILNDDPKKALNKLNQAKTRVDRLKKLKDK